MTTPASRECGWRTGLMAPSTVHALTMRPPTTAASAQFQLTSTNPINMETTLAVMAAPKTGMELAASASAALAKATIEAKFTVALHKPRSIETSRLRLLDNCKRRGFADGAIWKVPRGGKELEGFSIRFAEAAVQCWGNVDVMSTIAFEDDEKRLVRITVTDLETNISYTDEVMLSKTVERKSVDARNDVLGERMNSEGKKVYIVRATEDELLQKINAAKSKSIRTSGLRLLPQDMLDEAWDTCKKASEEGGKDPALALKKICDAFYSVGVQPSDIQDYIGHSIKSVSPAELADLRKIYAAVKDGETSWHDYIKAKKPVEVKAETVAPAKPKPAADADDIPGLEAKPAAAVVVQPGDLSPAQKELAAMLDGIPFDTFKEWLLATENLKADAICDDMSMVPNGVCELLLGKPKIMANAVKMMRGAK